jgi:dipeptidyl aminopeptidase/acylaminoacyl peptidase
MTSRDPLIVVLLASWGFLAFPGSAEAEFLAVGGAVYIIDERTGNGVPVGTLGSYGGGGSLAIDRRGTPYTTMNVGYPLNGIYLVTLGRQDGFWLPSLGPRIGLHVPGLAFSPSGTLFAIGNNDATGDDLYTIDVDTGVRTLVGSTRLFGIQALEFSPQGILYGFDGGTERPLWDFMFLSVKDDVA